MSRFLVVAFALVFPAAALAQPGDDPTAPESDQTPSPIVIQPTTPAPRTAYVTELPRYETYYESWNRPLFASGAIVFLTAYGASAIVAGTSADDVIDRGQAGAAAQEVVVDVRHVGQRREVQRREATALAEEAVADTRDLAQRRQSDRRQAAAFVQEAFSDVRHVAKR
jgi:hypothetical protein